MELQFLELPGGVKKPKATIHITGKLGFNMKAKNFMDIGEGSFFKIATNEEDVEKKLYFVPSQAGEKGSFKVSKAGPYYYMNLGSLFDNIGIEYKKSVTSFDIAKTEYKGGVIFVLSFVKDNRVPRDRKTKS